jgi:prolyl-tRNA synthetase
VDFEDAEKQISENLEIMKRLAKRLCLPYVMCKRPEWDKFAGAFYTIGLDSLMPTGRTLQMGSIHQYKENFSRPYEIKYEDENGEHKHVHQTTFGMSERILGALVSIHADDKGIILPPDIAPIQVIIIPIYSKEDKDKVKRSCDDVDGKLNVIGIRTHIDDRDLRPGNKFFDWELRGVPLRIEIGSRDIENDMITVARRDASERCQIKKNVAVDEVRSLLESIQRDLHRKVNEEMGKNIQAIDELSGVKDGINSIFWCGEEDCGHQIEDITEMSLLGEPVDKDPTEGNCIICGKPTKKTIYIAKTY